MSQSRGRDYSGQNPISILVSGARVSLRGRTIDRVCDSFPTLTRLLVGLCASRSGPFCRNAISNAREQIVSP